MNHESSKIQKLGNKTEYFSFILTIGVKDHKNNKLMWKKIY